jgi:hypothetical protein
MEADKATRLFSSDDRVEEPRLPAGPSEYTMIISRSELLGQSETNAVVPVAASQPASPFMMPPVAAVPPAPAPPTAPAPPQFPQMNMPQAPAQSAAPKPQVSYWPLILSLTVLFFVALLLVMYFALRH